MALYAALNALNTLNQICPMITEYGFGVKHSVSRPQAGDSMHGVVDVSHHDSRDSFYSMIEDRWPSSTPNWNSVVMVNMPLHTNDVIKFGLRGLFWNIYTIKSALAILVDVQNWAPHKKDDVGSSGSD